MQIRLVSQPAELTVYCCSLSVWKCQAPADFSLFWLHHGGPKCTVAAEEVWKGFLCGCLGSLGYHKSFVFLISKPFHRGHRKGKFIVWGGSWGRMRVMGTQATLAASGLWDGP